MLNVVLVADESAGIGALRRLAQSPHHVVAVLTGDAGHGSGGATVARVARQLEVPVWPAERVRDAALAGELVDAGVDLLLNVHSLFIVAAAVLEAPRIGSFNLHPGPLPRYAGLNAPSWAILEGEREHAVTVHWMEAGIDTGAIAYERRFAIGPSDTGLSVALTCVREGLVLIDRLLEDAVRATVPVVAQDLGARRYFDGKPPFEGRLPWGLPAQQVVDLVRAADYRPFASPWGHPVATLGSDAVRVVDVAATGEPAGCEPGTVEAVDGAGARVAAGDGLVLVRRVQRGDEAVADARNVLREGNVLT